MLSPLHLSTCSGAHPLGSHHVGRKLALLVAVALQTASLVAAQRTAIGTAAEEVANVTITSDILGVICIVLGALFCYFGTSLWRLTLFVAGFLFSYFFAYAFLLNLEGPLAGGNYGPNRSWILVGVSLFIGLLGAVLAGCLYKIGVFLMGALGGFFLATWILAFVADEAITSGAGRIAFLLISAILVGLLALFVEKHVIIFATSFAGAYAVVYGIDLFVGSGFSAAADAALTEARRNGSLAGTVDDLKVVKFANPAVAHGLVVAMFVLALSGVVVQYRRFRPLGSGMRHKKGDV